MNWYKCPAINKAGLPMKIAISSRQELVELYNKYSPGFFSNAALIEIVNDNKDAAEFYGGRFSRKITISFSDSSTGIGTRSFAAEQAKRIVEFTQSFDDHIDKVIVACMLGRSRSAGIAAALVKYYCGDDMQIWGNPQYSPNPLCYRLLVEAFGLDHWGW